MGMTAEKSVPLDNVEEVGYHDDYWHVNIGDEKIHAARMKGRFRTYKWMAASFWLLYFLGPYFRWQGRQAILFDIPHRKFHIFSLTIWPQDVWMLSLVLLFLALTLFAVTAVAGRVFCGYFCFQTVWTDVFTLIENWLEGPPNKRRQLDRAPLTAKKLSIRSVKYLIWLAISVLTGVTFAAYFADVFWLWRAYFTLDAPVAAWVTLGLFTAGTFIFAGFMREQVCFWLCPYARIQGVMYDKETILPTYDWRRGEPRSRLKKGKSAEAGDCIDCNLCVAVCPTGVDIRRGQQEGCITCGLCIDACDFIMDKVGRPRGLIRYASLDEMEGTPQPPLFKRPRVIIYSIILLVSIAGIIFGIANISPMDVKVIHERQPLFVRLSDGSIQNKYTLKVVNRTEADMMLRIAAEGPDGLDIIGLDGPVEVPVGKVTPLTVFVRVPQGSVNEKITPLTFLFTSVDDPDLHLEYESMFMAPGSG